MSWYTKPDKLYFISTLDKSVIKIGVTCDVEARFGDMLGNSPVALYLAAQVSGGYPLEKSVHYAFWKHRSHREWFFSHPDIWDAINCLNTTGKLPAHLYPDPNVKIPRFKGTKGARRKRLLDAAEGLGCT